MALKCIVCSSIFNLSSKLHPNQKYCGSKCIKTAYNIKNRDKVAASKAKWILKNPEKRKLASENYRKANTAYYTQYSSLRTRNMSKAKVKSLTELDELYLVEYYDLAKRRGLEVDHIIPIKHSKICGLHVPWNLQMLTRSENAMKNNKYCDEDVVAVLKENNNE